MSRLKLEIRQREQEANKSEEVSFPKSLYSGIRKKRHLRMCLISAIIFSSRLETFSSSSCRRSRSCFWLVYSRKTYKGQVTVRYQSSESALQDAKTYQQQAHCTFGSSRFCNDSFLRCSLDYGDLACVASAVVIPSQPSPEEEK
jgi:predicted nucleic acid binding AN1-type Zn finger protein